MGMSTTTKPSTDDVRAAALRVKHAHGKTPLERMQEVVELTRRCREMEQLANVRRATDPDRAR
jgi:hypothetical protein